MESSEQEMTLITNDFQQPEQTTTSKNKVRKFANKKCLKFVLFLLILCYFGLIALFYQNSNQVKNVEKKNIELENKIQDYLKEISTLQEQQKQEKKTEINDEKKEETEINENINNENINKPSFNFIDRESDILSPEDFSLLNNWIFQGQISFNRVFSSKIDKITPENFHSKFDSKSITKSLIVIQLKDGQIIGGYTNNNWKPNEYKTDKYAFLFNLKNKKRYFVSDKNKAIFTNKDYVVVFGDGDIIIKNEKDAYSLFPISYGNKYDNFKNELTDGKKFFEIEKLEGFVVEEIDLVFYD
jgi:hypothetical protein